MVRRRDGKAESPSIDYKLVLTVWETIPFLDTYRNCFARDYRAHARRDRSVPAATGGAPGEGSCSRESNQIGSRSTRIDLERFSDAARPDRLRRNVVVSPGRLVWEKGHRDVMQALAAIKRQADSCSRRRSAATPDRGVLVERCRLRAYADELGIGEEVEFRSRSVRRDARSTPRLCACCQPCDWPEGGLARRPAALLLGEQFELVLAEERWQWISIVASIRSAIQGWLDEALLLRRGDWMELARLLAAGAFGPNTAARTRASAAGPRTPFLDGDDGQAARVCLRPRYDEDPREVTIEIPYAVTDR